MRFVFGFMLFEAGAIFGFFVAALLNAARAGQEITIKFKEDDNSRTSIRLFSGQS